MFMASLVCAHKLAVAGLIISLSTPTYQLPYCRAEALSYAYITVLALKLTLHLLQVLPSILHKGQKAKRSITDPHLLQTVHAPTLTSTDGCKVPGAPFMHWLQSTCARQVQQPMGHGELLQGKWRETLACAFLAHRGVVCLAAPGSLDVTELATRGPEASLASHNVGIRTRPTSGITSPASNQPMTSQRMLCAETCWVGPCQVREHTLKVPHTCPCAQDHKPLAVAHDLAAPHTSHPRAKPHALPVCTAAARPGWPHRHSLVASESISSKNSIVFCAPRHACPIRAMHELHGHAHLPGRYWGAMHALALPDRHVRATCMHT